MKSFQTGGESGNTAKITVKWETFFFFCSNRLGLARSLCLIFDSSSLWGPLHMIPVDRDEFRLGFIWEISAWFPRREKAKNTGDEFWRQIRETMQTWRNTKVYDIENTTGNARRCHPDRQNSSRFHPGDGNEWSIYMAKLRTSLPRSRLEKLRSREQSQPVLSYEHIDNFTKDLEVRGDLGNRAHVKRPWVKFERDVLKRSQYFEQSPGHFASSWERRRKWGSGLNHVKLLKPP